ncbi:MAG: HAD-IA family hydrolase [Candidatus Saccharimonadales bacterium]
MIKAVIFDCLGVLTTDGWKMMREEYFTNDVGLMQRALDIDKAVNAGMIEYDEFIAEVAKMTGLSDDETYNRISYSNVANTTLFEYIYQKLKPTYKIGMLSNAADNWLNNLFIAEQIAVFDEILLSYQIGTTKPDSLMYETISYRLGVEPDECIFVDDQPYYIEASERLGMKGVHFADTKSVIQNIEELIRA